MKKVAIITARAGSKGLKDKNIIDLCGKPLIAYSIEAAIESKAFDRVIVSTDSKKYGKISEKYGAEVIYRDERLAGDNVPTFDVVEDLLSKLNNDLDYFVLLQPTSPMRTYKHICEAITLFENNYDNFDFLVSVKKSEVSSVLIKEIDEDNSLKNFNIDFSNYKRQNFQEYTPNGALFFAKPRCYLLQRHFFGERSLAYKMTDVDSIDIDDKLDYELAKVCMIKRMEENNE